jgi:hypothetical protein
MNKRPPTITALSILYMLVGLVSTSYHLSQIKAFPTFVGVLESLLMIVLGAAAVAAGYFMLQGKNWARWLAFGWTLFHMILSAFQTPGAVFFHGAFVFLLWLLLFSKEAKQWFTPTPTPVPAPPAIPPPDLATPPADVTPLPPDAPPPPAI